MATIKQIAKAAHVSPSTVSKALNQRNDVSEETRKRIIEIAETFNFYPSANGKNLKRRITENIGVVISRESQPLSGNPFYSRVVEGIEAELAMNNYSLILHLLPQNFTGSLPKIINERKVDGVILAGVLTQDLVERLREIEFNAVLVDPKIPLDDFSQILIDNEHGAFTATQYLIQKGHTRIGFISGDLDRLSFLQRFEGYKKALNYYHISFDQELIQTGGLERGYDHTANLLRLKEKPTAIFAANDINATYGYKAIKDAGLSIPDDMSIVGFDDIELSKISSPPLTTIRVYKEEMGSIAVRTLLQMFKKEIQIPEKIVVPTRLVERESVKNLGS